MRGGDGGLLALTQRQINTIAAAIEKYETFAGDTTPDAAMRRMISHFNFAAVLHAGVQLPNQTSLSDLFANADSLIAYLKNPNSTARGQTAINLGLDGQRLVVPQDPSNSALISMVKLDAHPMNSPFQSYSDSLTGSNGIEVLEQWVNSLPV